MVTTRLVYSRGGGNGDERKMLLHDIKKIHNAFKGDMKIYLTTSNMWENSNQV